MSDPCRIALVGDGTIADQHAHALASAGARVAVVVGVVKERVSRFAHDHGIEAWSTEFEAAIEDKEISAVVVASPNEMHVPQTLAALSAGKHVLCEVPVATSLADARRVVDQVAETGLVCTVGHSSRHLPLLARLRRLTVAGELDPLHLVTVTGLMRRRDHNVGMDGRPRDWVDSVIWHHGSHAVDTALWLLNDQVDRVQAAAGAPDRTDGRPLDVSITLETSAGRLAVLTLSYNSSPAHRRDHPDHQGRDLLAQRSCPPPGGRERRA